MSRLQERISVTALWARLAPLPGGRALFTRAFQLAAPYSGTIPVRVTDLAPGRATADMRDTRAVRNHIGTVHAIALCNLAETVMGLVAEATIPKTHRWIPKAMQVEYRARARGTLSAEARLATDGALPDGGALAVAIDVHDRGGVLVFRANIDIWVTRRSS